MQVFDLPDPNFEPLSLSFSPDGRLLAGWSWGRVCVVDAATGTARAMLGEKEVTMSAVPGVGFTADGRAVVGHRDYLKPPVCVYDLDSGAVLRRCPDGHGRGVRVGPGGRFVYLVHRPRESWVEIVRWDPLTGGVSPPFARHKGHLRQLAVSADERWVAGASGDTVRVWDLGGEKSPDRAVRKLDLDADRISGLALSADGAFVAYNGYASSRVCDVRTGETWKVADVGVGHSEAVAFHPARALLAFSGPAEEVAFYDAAARAEVKRFAWNVGAVVAVAFSADGLRCAAASRGKVVVWDVDA